MNSPAQDPGEPAPAKQIVYFDGVCGLCNRFVDYLITADRRGDLCFAPLQGETARRRLGRQAAVLETVVVERAGKAFTRSTAALVALTALGRLHRVLAIFYLVPRPLRDAIYGWVARHRYSWFGKRDVCRLPSPAERARFLP
jgi:predicted DCC family thiol-disulfide oxidoreductase YuxK